MVSGLTDPEFHKLALSRVRLLEYNAERGNRLRAGANKSRQITGIIKTMPHKFVFDEYGAVRFIEDFFYRPNADDRSCFLFTMPSIPRIQILHFYLLVDGRVRFRANIVEFRGPKTYHFAGHRSISGKAWVLVGAPVVRAPFKVDMKGFRGFRYTEELW